MKKRDTAKCMRLLLGVAVGLVLGACASIGRPEGGAIDEVPPVFVRSSPSPNQTDVSRGRVEVFFDENVQVKDVMGKVTVSPVQKSMPQVSAVGRKLTVELRDTLEPNTTYTIDFADAVSDLNEGNELDGFSVAFSTGPTIDTLCISGMVFEASNLEPAQGMIVGVYSNLSDTAIHTLPLERITRTNKFGQFTVRNLKAGTYRIYALNDMNRDYKWDRTEDVAFYDVTITPTTQGVTLTDTTYLANGDIDSIKTHPGTIYLPNDILLTWFNENYKSQYLKKYERQTRERIHFEFGAPADTLPQITIINGPLAGRDIKDWAVVDGSKTLDTLDYWISAPEVLAMDSIKVAARFKRTDTLDQLSWGTDTLDLNLKVAKKKKDKEKNKKKEKELNDSTDSVAAPIVFSSLQIASPGTQDLNLGLLLKTAVPMSTFDHGGVHMEMQVDTLWEAVEAPRFYMPDSLRPMVMVADYKWEPGTKYRLTIDSLAMVDIYGHHNKALKHDITTRKVEDYSTIHFSLPGVEGPAMVQLLNAQDAPVKTVAANGGGVTIDYVQPGVYYARLWLDRNGNGIYDGGILDSIQPEEVYYFPKRLTLKKNWDIDQTWNIYEVAIDQQKPNDIKKNKPKPKRGEEIPQEDEEDDGFYDPSDPFGQRRNNSRSNRNSFRGGGFGAGGLRQAVNR